MSAITVANVLLLVIAGLLLQRSEPEWTHRLYVIAAVVLGYSVFDHYFMKWQNKKAEKARLLAQQRHDYELYEEFQAKLRRIHELYDPKNGWDGAKVPGSCQADIRDLRTQYIDVLRRRFGPEEMP